MDTLSGLGITESSHPNMYCTFKMIAKLYDALNLENVQSTKLGRLREKLWVILKNNARSDDFTIYWDFSVTLADLRKPRGYSQFTSEIQEYCKRLLGTLNTLVSRTTNEKYLGVIKVKEITD